MNVDLALDRPEFRRPDQLRMGDRDRMQGTGEFALPEIEKVDEDGETGSQIVFLPDIGLQEGRVVRHTVEDLGGRQSVAFHLADEVLGYHANSFSQAPASPSDRYPPQWHRRFPALCSRLNLECNSRFPQDDGVAHSCDVALIAWNHV